MGDSYSTLGGWFEYLNDDCDYEKWSQYLLKKLSGFPQGARGCDMGCGNGYFTRALQKAGYLMTGVDKSAEMLSRAEDISLREGVRSSYVLGDITKLTLSPKVDFMVAVNDCLNYVPPERIPAAFRHVYESLNRGGLFVFDISSAYKLEHVLGDNVFCEDRDDISYMWFNSFDAGVLTFDLTFFLRQGDGSYLRRDERHVQYAHTEEDILSALEAAGFGDVSSEGDMGGDKEMRINFFGSRK